MTEAICVKKTTSTQDCDPRTGSKKEIVHLYDSDGNYLATDEKVIRTGEKAVINLKD